MVNRNNPDSDALLQEVIEHLRRQEVPDFPDPEITALTQPQRHAFSMHPISTLRRMAMNRRFQLSAGAIVGLAAVLGFVLLWGGGTMQQASAMEKMAEKIREAKSLKVTLSATGHEAGKPQLTATETFYWLASGASRTETKHERQGELEEMDDTDIRPAGKPSISINHVKKLFQRYPPRLGHESPLWVFHELSTFSGRDNRNLGEKKINGVRAWGFEIDQKMIDPDGYAGAIEIWLDAESNLPVLIRAALNTGDISETYTMENFQWNIDLDPKLFVAEPPAGYLEQRIDFPSHQKELQEFRSALQTYAELCGGHYPRATRSFNNDLLDEMRGVAARSTTKASRNVQDKKVNDAWNGLTGFNSVLVLNPDAAYYGMTVGPKDKDKVLARWRLDYGRHQIVFGDLRSEVVTAERLRALGFEPKPAEAALPEELKTENVVRGLKLALRTYAKLCGGHYPRVTKSFAEPVRDEMYQGAGLPKLKSVELTLHDKRFHEAYDAFQGFAVFDRVLLCNADAAYYGKTVKPGEKEKALLRWKLDDGRYEVIFGDLHAETVTAERLRALEGGQPPK